MDELHEMTNKEAAFIIACMVHNIPAMRGNGKSMMMHTRITALLKAIEVLEKTPD